MSEGERDNELFEFWASRRGLSLATFMVESSECYSDRCTNEAWQSWQAGRAEFAKEVVEHLDREISEYKDDSRKPYVSERTFNTFQVAADTLDKFKCWLLRGSTLRCPPAAPSQVFGGPLVGGTHPSWPDMTWDIIGNDSPVPAAQKLICPCRVSEGRVYAHHVPECPNAPMAAQEPQIGTNSVNYSDDEPPIARCQDCHGYHHGGCHRKPVAGPQLGTCDSVGWSHANVHKLIPGYCVNWKPVAETGQPLRSKFAEDDDLGYKHAPPNHVTRSKSKEVMPSGTIRRESDVTGASERTTSRGPRYVSNSGQIAGVSDRVDLSVGQPEPEAWQEEAARQIESTFRHKFLSGPSMHMIKQIAQIIRKHSPSVESQHHHGFSAEDCERVYRGKLRLIDPEEWDQMRVQVAQLSAWLRKYGGHAKGCNSRATWIGWTLACNCGWAEVEAGLGEGL